MLLFDESFSYYHQQSVTAIYTFTPNIPILLFFGNKRHLIPELEVKDVGLWVWKRPNTCSQVTVKNLQDLTAQ
jgi:hypothetical protein